VGLLLIFVRSGDWWFRYVRRARQVVAMSLGALWLTAS
jgi:hypothetical protein